MPHREKSRRWQWSLKGKYCNLLSHLLEAKKLNRSKFPAELKLGLELMSVASIILLLTDHRQDKDWPSQWKNFCPCGFSQSADEQKRGKGEGGRKEEKGYWERIDFEQVTLRLNTRARTRTRTSRSPAQRSTHRMLTHWSLDSDSSMRSYCKPSICPANLGLQASLIFPLILTTHLKTISQKKRALETIKNHVLVLIIFSQCSTPGKENHLASQRILL